VGTEHWGGLSDFWGNKVFGYDTALSVGERVTVSVEGNLIQDCNTGFFLRYDSDATLRNNTVVSCGKALTVWDEPTAKLRHNCIAANVTGIDISPFAGERLSIDATENWWGHASGPLHPTNPDGQGNYVGSRATITPWLTMDNCFVDVASAVIGPAGGTVSTTSGAASVSLPAGAVSQDTRVSIRPMKPSAMDTMPAPPGGLSPVRLFQAAAQDDATGTPVTELDEGAAFSARLSQAEAAGVDPATLTLARLEAGASSSQGGAAPGTTPAWALLPTQVDLVSVALTATSEYLGTFAVLGEPTAASIYLPLVSRSGVLP
jgi:parallel beta-helix repeat protein